LPPLANGDIRGNLGMNLITELRQRFGERAVLDSEQLAERAAGIWRPLERLSGRALVRPENTEQISELLAFSHEHEIPVVTQGGLTGLVHGADTSSECVILSLERMNQIETIDAPQRCARAQAGVTLQQLQEAVAPHGLMFPLDLGARGTATIGGNAATNAGGNRVLRYGMMRDMVLGLEAVLADGTVINALNPLIKNNAGFDVRQLFIGSEGTLGVITRLDLRLRETLSSHQMAFASVQSFDAIKQLLRHMDRELGGGLSAFEVLWREFYQLVTTPPARGRAPLETDAPYYVLLEAQGSQPENDRARFEQALSSAFEAGLIDDAVLSQSESDCERFWGLRDDVQNIFNDGHAYTFDVSLPIDRMERYVEDVKAALTAEHIQNVWVFGHLGDGNIHFAVQVPRGSEENHRAEVDRAVYSPLASFRGSVSAEHGIGEEKKGVLDVSRTPETIALMRTLKQALDPKNLLNRGKVIDV